MDTLRSTFRRPPPVPQTLDEDQQLERQRQQFATAFPDSTAKAQPATTLGTITIPATLSGTVGVGKDEVPNFVRPASENFKTAKSVIQSELLKALSPQQQSAIPTETLDSIAGQITTALAKSDTNVELTTDAYRTDQRKRIKMRKLNTQSDRWEARKAAMARFPLYRFVLDCIAHLNENDDPGLLYTQYDFTLAVVQEIAGQTKQKIYDEEGVSIMKPGTIDRRDSDVFLAKLDTTILTPSMKIAIEQALGNLEQVLDDLCSINRTARSYRETFMRKWAPPYGDKFTIKHFILEDRLPPFYTEFTAVVAAHLVLQKITRGSNVSMQLNPYAIRPIRLLHLSIRNLTDRLQKLLGSSSSGSSSRSTVDYLI